MAEPLIYDFTIKDTPLTLYQFNVARQLRQLYNDGHSFWWIYNNYLLPNFRTPAGEGYYSDALKAFKFVRKLVLYQLYPELDFKGAKSGKKIDYWPGYDSLLPNFQITAGDLRVTFWNITRCQYFSRSDKWFGEMFFEPMLPLTPEDQQAYIKGGKSATRFGNRENVPNIVNFGGVYCYEALGSELVFVYNLQYVIDILMGKDYRWNLWDKASKSDEVPQWVVVFSLTFGYRADYAKQSDFLGNVNYLLPPQRFVSLFEKIVAGTAIGLSALMTIATAGAGSPLLAAILATLTGQVVKNASEALKMPPGVPEPDSEPAPPIVEPGAPQDQLKKFLPYIAIAAAIIVIDQNT